MPLFSVVGALGTWGLGSRNGLGYFLANINTEETPLFPGSDDKLLKSYTGISILDAQLTTLVAFFAPTVDKSNPALFLFTIFGLGQFGGAWTLLVLESMRSGNIGKYKAVS